ncbi:MAG: M20 family metallopeptidase [Thermotogae bacterium]|jgi:N-acetyldiaminopimelate deacetylase|nr:M20 family metallopeptidase [Thermotogota bacterium]
MDGIELRHIIHQNPELSFEEHETQKVLKSAIEGLGSKAYPVAKTGLIVPITRDKDEPYMLLRSDMDALPIKEQTRWEYASKNEYMHACGHDVHMAVMYETLKRILKEKVKGNFIFVFQPAEENGGGAARVIEEIKNLYKIKCAIAEHVTDEYEFGTLACRPGVLFASATEINLTFKGKAAHIAFYKNGIDAIMAGTDFLTQFYKVNFESKVLAGFGKVFGGNARNIVADTFELQGTIRSESLEKTQNVIDKISEIADKSRDKIGATFFLRKGSVYPQVRVDEKMFESFKKTISKSNFKLDLCDMKYTGEDFGFFSLEYPSLMFWAGTFTGKNKAGLHNPLFLPDDKIIEPLAKFISLYVRNLLGSE